MKQMPKEAAIYYEVHEIWLELIKNVDKDKQVLSLYNVKGLLNKLLSSLDKISEINKGLQDYLDKKRLFFPRFFFLSDEELLNILAETRDPELVQPHLKKCFAGMDQLTFTSTVEIIGMKGASVGGEREEIPFQERIIPREYKSNVEEWLMRVEEEMVKTLKAISFEALDERRLNKIPYVDWLRKWSSQFILCISQILWTFSINENLASQSRNSMLSY